MPTSPRDRVIRHLLADLRPEGDGLTDGDLLARFVRGRDEDALAALVWRHARMVWGVCRRHLVHHDAEDAFQATFLVLVRKAACVPREAVANWLYGVARQTAVRLRATAAKRGRRETQVVDMPEPTTPGVHDGDVQQVVDEELSRLPGHYRGVVVLCDLEGMTRREAARQLGIPEGSVASRLARARAMLAKRLARRGVGFSGGSVAAVLSAGSASASAPPALVASTIKAASLVAAGQAAGVVSANVAALAGGVVKAMAMTRITSVLAVALVAGLVFGGIGAGIGLPTRSATAVAQQPVQPDDMSFVTGGREKKGDRKGFDRLKMLPGEYKRELNLGVVLRVKLAELDTNALLLTGDVEPTKDILNPNKPLRLANLPIAGSVFVTDGTKELKLTDLKVGGILRLQLESWNKDGEQMAITSIRVEDGTGKSKTDGTTGGATGGTTGVKAGPEKPMTKEEKLRVLTDNVLAAHGGEDRLNKLQFTMTVKHSNGYVNKYWVQPPRNLRWETTFPNQTAQWVVILFPEGRRWWTKEPNEEAKEFRPTGAELTLEVQFDRVKFFGPRQVLRLKDAEHKVALLDEEARVGDRAAVGVEVTGPQFQGKMYFDKETHLLLKGFGSDIGREVTFGDYKKFDGIPIAQKEHDGHFEPVVTDFKVADKFDSKVFEQP